MHKRGHSERSRLAVSLCLGEWKEAINIGSPHYILHTAASQEKKGGKNARKNARAL